MLLSQGWEAAREGKVEGAEDLFRRAVEADGRLWGAWTALIRIQVQRGEIGAARTTLARAARTSIPRTPLLVHEALVDAAAGDSVGAHQALDQVPRGAIESDQALSRVAAWARDLLARGR